MIADHRGDRSIASEVQRPPFQVLSSRFLKRTVVATLFTLALVAMTAAAYGYPRWSGYYLVAGVWSLVFLGLTPLIVKAMMFDRRPLLGLLLILAKFVWLGALFVLFLAWSRGDGGGRVLGSALIAGVTTPLLVVFLRAVGGMMETRRPGPKS